MPRILKLTISYDGTNFAGWQSQLAVRTVQDTVEAAILKVTGESLRILASGRTDTGVHALAQVASFPSNTGLDCQTLHRALNASLPEDVRILAVADERPGFHPIRSVLRKRYRYLMQDSSVHNVFMRSHAWHWPANLDENAMHRASQVWLGTHDFCSFESSGSARSNSIRTVNFIQVCRRNLSVEGIQGATVVSFEIEADGFLYHMVRCMAGTLMEIGRGQKPESWAKDVLQARDRKLAGMNAPPQGLYLVHVTYKPHDAGAKVDQAAQTPDESLADELA